MSEERKVDITETAGPSEIKSETEYEICKDICEENPEQKALSSSSNLKQPSVGQYRPFQCEICEESFGQWKIFKKHLYTHRDERPFKCSACKNNFKRKHHLDKHMITHSSEKPFKCKACKKTFKRKESLPSHMKTHSSEKPFKCEVCEKGFPLKKYLSIHMKTHSGEKPFKCDACQTCFSRKSTLNRHMQLHVGKSFKCDVCEKGFTLKSRLNVHMETHLSENPPECEIPEKNVSHVNEHVADEKCIPFKQDNSTNCNDGCMEEVKCIEPLWNETVETVVKIKEEFVDTIDESVSKLDEKPFKFSEITICKEEPNEEHFEISENSDKGFANLTEENYEDTKAFIKKEPIEYQSQTN